MTDQQLVINEKKRVCFRTAEAIFLVNFYFRDMVYLVNGNIKLLLTGYN